MKFGGTVIVTCSAKVSADLKWKLPMNETEIVRKMPGVATGGNSTAITLELNLSVFQFGRTVSCGVDGDNPRENHTVCGEYCMLL